jgi:adenylosuccinate lyase
MITAISPIDGRYASKVEELGECFSEYALVRNRVKVEVLWLLALCAEPKISECRALTTEEEQSLRAIVTELTPAEAEMVKAIEKVTNHDVKAVEYYLKEQITGTSLEGLSEFLHFACTSEDINNLSHAMMLKDGLQALEPLQEKIVGELKGAADIGAEAVETGRQLGVGVAE